MVMTEFYAIKLGSGLYEISILTDNQEHYESGINFATQLIGEKPRTNEEVKEWIVGMDGSYMCPICNSVFRYEIGYFCSNCGTELKME